MAAPNNTYAYEDSDGDDVGALIYREVQLRKAEAVAAAAAAAAECNKTSTASTHQRTSSRKISPIENQTGAGESLPSLQRKGAMAMKRRKQESSNADDRPRKKWVKKRCFFYGCTNKARKGGVCNRHGDGANAKRKLCSSEGCTNMVRQGGVCTRHGAERKLCSREGCTNIAHKGGVCVRRGAKIKRCSSEGCTKYALKGGVCIRHGAKKKICSSDGCTNQVVKGGLCRRHGQSANDAVVMDVLTML